MEDFLCLEQEINVKNHLLNQTIKKFLGRLKVYNATVNQQCDFPLIPVNW